jgi:hypothetical protein
VNCYHCGEPIVAELAHRITTCDGPAQLHHECNFRLIAGSVAHIERRCSCFVAGASETDDPRLSRRQAARAALDAWYRIHTRDCV